MAKSKTKKKYKKPSGGGQFRKAAANPQGHRARRRHSQNPLPIPWKEAPAAVAGTVAGGAVSFYLPEVLGLTGIMNYGLALVATIAGGFAFGKWGKFALGWVLGGLSVTAVRAIDEFTGTQYIAFNQPLGSYYSGPIQGVSLPAPMLNTFGPPRMAPPGYASGPSQAPSQAPAGIHVVAALPAGHPAATGQGSVNTSNAGVNGMGWNPAAAA